MLETPLAALSRWRISETVRSIPYSFPLAGRNEPDGSFVKFEYDLACLFCRSVDVIETFEHLR
jgi:hypothetical protein